MTERRLTVATESLEKKDFSHALALANAGLKRAPGSHALQMIKIECSIETGDIMSAYNLTTNVRFLADNYIFSLSTAA